MVRAGVAFGSNLGDRAGMLRAARECLLAGEGVEPPMLASRLYRTSPEDCPPGSEYFLNAVVEISLTGAPMDLLRHLRRCEQGLGRKRPDERNAPRTIDLDLLYAGEMRINTPELELPHPRLTERRFVLAPLAEIRPGLVLPGQADTVAELLRKLPRGSDFAEPLDIPW